MEINEALVIPAIIGLVLVLRSLKAPAWVLPLASLALGIVAALGVFPAETQAMSILKGVVFGLSASGLWSGGKALVGR